MKKILVLCLWAICMLAGPALGLEPVTFVSVDWQPYAGELLPEFGVGSAIIAEACRRGGLEPSFHFMPWKRAMEDVARGKHDALYSAYTSKKRERDYAVSQPYLHGRLVLCARKGNPVAWNGTLESLRPHRLGVVLGYVNTPGIDNAHFLQKDTAPTDLLNLKKLLTGRLDVIVIDQFQAVYLLKNNPTLSKGVEDVTFLSPALDRKGIHVMFSRQKPGWQDRLERFNRGLADMERDGTKEYIMEKFGFILPEDGE